MCKYCKQISTETGLSESSIHTIIDLFIKLREADGIFSLEIDPECMDIFDDEEEKTNDY
jgi:hypothetical protein